MPITNVFSLEDIDNYTRILPVFYPLNNNKMNQTETYVLFQATIAHVLGEEEKDRVVERILVTADHSRLGYDNYRPVSDQTPRNAPKFHAIHFHIERLKLEQLMMIHVSTNYFSFFFKKRKIF